jgi:hypothetical protein
MWKAAGRYMIDLHSDLHSVLHSISRRFPVGFLSHLIPFPFQLCILFYILFYIPFYIPIYIPFYIPFYILFPVGFCLISFPSHFNFAFCSVFHSISLRSDLTRPGRKSWASPWDSQNLDRTGPKTFTIPDRPKDWEISLGPAHRVSSQPTPARLWRLRLSRSRSLRPDW